MMEHNCGLLKNLCISISKSKLVVCQKTHKLCMVEHVLDLLASLIEAERTSDNLYDTKPQGIHAQVVGLERSRLCSASSILDSETKRETKDPERIEFTSEVLYCNRLLDVTPTDERLLANPRRVLQISDEIANIQHQNWQFDECHSSGTSAGIVCICMREHLMCLVKMLCGELIDGHWSEVLNEVLTDVDSKGTTYQYGIHGLGVKLCNILTNVKTLWHQKSNSNVTRVEEEDSILQSVGQILAQMPNWTKEAAQANVTPKTDLGVQVAQICNFLNGLARELQDSSLLVTMPTKATGLSMKNEKGDWFQGVIRKIDERLQGYEDCLVQMLIQPHLWEEEEWITCLERNSTALGISSVCKQLCDVILRMNDQCRNSAKLNRLLKVFLTSFAALPPLIQNQICEGVWSHPSGHSLFSDYNQTGFHQEMTTAFNRLINVDTAEGLEETIGRLSHVALQSPCDTLHTAITRAVSNSASTQSVLKILQMLPALARFKQPGDERLLLVQILRDVIDTSNDISTTEEANLIHVISELLQPYKLTSSCPYQEPPLLSHSVLMESCILPYLHCCMMGSDDNQQPVGRLELCVKLLNVTLISFESQTSLPDAVWMPGISPFPIILCLCDILDQSHALWDRDSPSCLTPESKELVIEILSRLGSVVQTSHTQDTKTFECGLQWLLSKMSDLHWTVQLQLVISLEECLPGYKKAVPACLFDLCDLSSDYWTAIPSTESGSSSLKDQLVSFMQCCRISDQLSSQLCQILKPKDNPTRQDFFQATLVAMTTVLPQSSLGEFERITSVVKLLIEESTLHVSLSSQFLTCLPMFSYIDYRVSLSMCQLFTSFVTLLASPCCENWVSMPLWVHTIKGVVMCIKNIASDIPTSVTKSPSAPGSVFALTQILCHTCHMITTVPGDITDQLFVLALDLMGMIEDMLLANDIGQDGFEWTNERRPVEMVIMELEDGEQRKTLMQKLCSLKQST